MNGMVIVEGALDTFYFFLYFLLTVQRIWMSFSLNLLHPKGNYPSNFSLLEFAILEELGNTHTNKQTDSLISYCLYRVISFINTLVTTALVNFNCIEADTGFNLYCIHLHSIICILISTLV